MFDLTRKTLALGVSATCLLLQTTDVQATEYVQIGVAANFATTARLIADAYEYFHNDVQITINSDSTGNLKAAILAGGTTSGPYDLFLSADTAAPAAVSTLGMVYSGVTQSPFFYASGSIVFGSAITSVSGGVPNPIATTLVIADPSKAPYGLAAMTVLNQAPWSLGLSTTSSYPVSNVAISANISSTYAAINSASPTYAYGFVAKSAVCRNTGSGDTVAPSPNTVTNVYEYKYDGSAGMGHAGTTSQTYPQIVQNGIAIQRSAQTPTTQATVIDFIDFLVNNSVGTGYRVLYCYGT